MIQLRKVTLDHFILFYMNMFLKRDETHIFVVDVSFCMMQIEYPEIEDLVKPRHRFMSSFEQVGIMLILICL